MGEILAGKVAVITGGGSGIGQAIAIRFAQEGAGVVILELDLDKAEETISAIQESGGDVTAYACDVSSSSSVSGTFEQIKEKFSRIDILINNAGIAHIGNIEKTSEADLDRLYQVNVKGVYNCMKTAIDQMLVQGGGTIMNMASVASKVGIEDRFAYSMTKGAVLTMTYSVARDYVNKNIRCNCICPGRVHTPFVDNFLKANYPDRVDEMFKKLSESQPIGRMGQADEMANLALFLCSDQAGFITGSAYDIDGGFTTMR